MCTYNSMAKLMEGFSYFTTSLRMGVSRVLYRIFSWGGEDRIDGNTC